MIDIDKVSRLIEQIAARDPELGQEFQGKRREPERPEAEFRLKRESAIDMELPVGFSRDLVRETIVLRTGRPVLAISHDEAQLTFRDAESEVWRDRLTKAAPVLAKAARAVGRIELENNPRFDWVGTGWLVRPDIIVTNRHVASEFGRLSGESFVFQKGPNGAQMSTSLDFLQEFGNPARRSFPVARILHIEDEDGPDLAFLQLSGSGIADQIQPYGQAAAKQLVAVIGYPARDSRIPDADLMERLFGNVYDKKRLAPGQLIGVQEGELTHDCSTLGGNSGSVVLDVETGKAVGLHFAGRFLKANFAVTADILEDRLRRITGETRSSPPPRCQPSGNGVPQAVPPPQPPASPVPPCGTITCTIPIQVTVQVGAPYTAAAHVQPAQVGSDGPDVPVTEGVPEDYDGREGYQEDFLGEDALVALPTVVRDSNQIVEYTVNDETGHVLRYQYFSVVMNRKRRMCFFSAVNIDGKQSRKAVRTAWRADPRIPGELQIMYECYGNDPKFSRGHMTRREDPVWGTAKAAALGNSDSMHVTNVTPQMQSFNAPIWLGLEDYALQNARQDKMKISVITGPILKDKDPVRYGVKIPRTFFKVIAFIHDETGKLTTTGYSASQEEQMPEFVFGEYDTWQRPLAWIEQQAGLSFGGLSDFDPLADGREAPDRPLSGWQNIHF